MSRDKADELITRLNDEFNLDIEADSADGAAMAARILDEWDRGATLDLVDLITYFGRYSPSYPDLEEGERQQVRDGVEQFIEDNPDSVGPPDVEDPPMPEGTTFTLTQSSAIVDANTNIGTNQPDDVFPSADESDRFETTDTNLSASRIDGVGGGNTLDIFASAAGATARSVENVEEVLIEARQLNATFDVEDFVGVEEWWSNSSRTDITLSQHNEYGVVGAQGDHGTMTYTVNYIGSVTDERDEQAFALDGAGVRDGAAGVSFNVNGFEHYSIDNAGESTVNDIGGDELEQLTITGSGSLVVNGVSSDGAGAGVNDLITDLDATGFTGDDLDVDISNVGGTTVDTDDEDLSVQAGDSDARVNIGAVIDVDPTTWDGDSIDLDGGDGDNTLIFEAGSQAIEDLLEADEVSVSGWDTVIMQTTGDITATGAGNRLDMSLLEGTTTFGFEEGTGANDDDVYLNAGELTEDFSLWVGPGDDVDDIEVVDIRPEQTSLDLELMTELDGDNEFDTAADMDNLTLEADEDDDDEAAGIEHLTLTSSADGEISEDEDQLGVLDLGTGTADANSVGDISSEDYDDAQALRSLTVNAQMNLATGTVNVYDGEDAERDVLDLDLSGDGAIEFGEIDLDDTNVNQVAVDNAGSGDRLVTLSGDQNTNLGDLKAAGGQSQAPGEGVEVTGEGTGDVLIAADVANLSELEIDGSRYDGQTLAAVDSNSNTEDLDASNFGDGVDIALIADNGANNLEELASGTTVYVLDNQGGEPTFKNADGGDLNIVLDGSDDLGYGLADTEGLNSGVELENVDHATISAVNQDESGETVDVSGIKAKDDGDWLLDSLTLEAEDSADTLKVDGEIRIDADVKDHAFTLNFAGAGAIDLENNNLDLVSGAEQIPYLTLNSEVDIDSLDGVTIGADDDDAAATVTFEGSGDIATGSNDTAFDAHTHDVEDLTLTAEGSGSYEIGGDDGLEVGADDQDIDIHLAGSGELTLSVLDADNMNSGVLTLDTGEDGGDYTLEDINDLDTNADDDELVITGESDLTLGVFDEDGDPETGFTLADTEGVDASGLEGELTAFFDRTGDAGNEHDFEFSFGSGGGSFEIDDSGDLSTNNANMEGTFEFTTDDIGELSLDGFAAGSGVIVNGGTDGEDVLDFTEHFDGPVTFDGQGGADDDFTIEGDGDAVLNVESVNDDEDALITAVDPDESFEGELLLVGVGLDELHEDNFDFA
ncbi:hypothetical protein CKO15_07195 [Halorhodospira abdelmalekii]|uniref:hypothetical protein n=1 Tax=Halorhodospira abdelmalekii TaxID=421629 RepID=UPI001907F148|nr:hypothetical protein [Halorhodospira abdelmalekii]MBK1735073.1 hypothetical protein [Halorhodospira abdelmalekii]